MTFSHPLARRADVFSARGLDGEDQKILVVITTLELDPKSKRYNKPYVDKLSKAARDYVLRVDHVSAFMLINRPKEWHGNAKARHPRRGQADADSIAMT